MKVYFNIYFKGSHLDPISMPEAVYDTYRDAILSKEDTLIEHRDVTFNPKDIRYVKRVETYPDVPQHDYPEISEEKRQENLRRLAVLRELFFSGRRPRPEDWVNPYSDRRSVMTREELRAFDKEFFDVLFETHEEREKASAVWLSFHRGQRDPRDYDRTSIASLARLSDNLTLH